MSLGGNTLLDILACTHPCLRNQPAASVPANDPPIHPHQQVVMWSSLVVIHSCGCRLALAWSLSTLKVALIFEGGGVDLLDFNVEWWAMAVMACSGRVLVGSEEAVEVVVRERRVGVMIVADRGCLHIEEVVVCHCFVMSTG